MDPWEQYFPQFKGMVPRWLIDDPRFEDRSWDVAHEPWFMAQCDSQETDVNVNVTHASAFPAEATPEQLAASPVYYVHVWDNSLGALVVGETEDPDEAREWTEWALARCGDPDALYEKYPSSEYGYQGPKTVFTSRTMVPWGPRVTGRHPGPPAEARSREVQDALGEINRHRSRMGLSPLDPAAAGWTDQDVLDEAARIRRLANSGMMPA